MKSQLYKIGWLTTIHHLASLPTLWDKQIYSEKMWYECNKLMFDRLGTDSTQGCLDAIILWEKTGYIPSDIFYEGHQ